MERDFWRAEELAEREIEAKSGLLESDIFPAPVEILPLTAREYKFVAALMESDSLAAAARAAGITWKAAKDLSTQPAVKQELERRQKLAAIYSGRTAAGVMADVYEVFAEARARGDLKTALKALELEAKHRGALVERVELSAGGDIADAIQAARRRLGSDSDSEKPAELPTPDWF